MSKARKTGWWNPGPHNPRAKFHYCGPTGRSLCGKYLFIDGPDFVLEEGKDEHPDNCAKCKSVLRTRLRREPPTTHTPADSYPHP